MVEKLCIKHGCLDWADVMNLNVITVIYSSVTWREKSSYVPHVCRTDHISIKVSFSRLHTWHSSTAWWRRIIQSCDCDEFKIKSSESLFRCALSSVSSELQALKLIFSLLKVHPDLINTWVLLVLHIMRRTCWFDADENMFTAVVETLMTFYVSMVTKSLCCSVLSRSLKLFTEENET